MPESKGFLLHVFDSKKIDYAKLAICCALSIKSNLKINNVTILTDQKTKDQMNFSISEEVIKKAFDHIVVIPEKFNEQERTHYNSPWNKFSTKFKNQSRALSYKYSPYDKTILIDVDYLIQNDDLDRIWNTTEDILINKKANNLLNCKFGSNDEQRLGKYGIPMYWATLVYFNKSKYSEVFFNLVDYIREEYNFFQFIYGFKKSYYRNDFSFSIATHIMNGYTFNTKSFPIDTIITSDQKDTIFQYKTHNEIIFFVNDIKETWKNYLVNAKNMNVHIMNKKEILRISDDLIKCCLEKMEKK